MSSHPDLQQLTQRFLAICVVQIARQMPDDVNRCASRILVIAFIAHSASAARCRCVERVPARSRIAVGVVGRQPLSQ